MKIRLAIETDIPALQSILRNSWLTTWAPELEFATVQRFAATDPAGQYASDKWPEFIVIEDVGVLSGMAHVEDDHLNAIHLDPRRRRRGIGTLLIDEAERVIASAHPVAFLEVLEFNVGAIAFYTRRGWTVRRRYTSLECGQEVPTLEMTKSFAVV